MLIKAAIYPRVSTDKQMRNGESPQAQVEVCLRKADAMGLKINEIKVFPAETFTGKKINRPVLDSVFEFIDQNPSVEFFFIKCIDRLSRGGAGEYNEIKKKLSIRGVRLIDTEGIIQPETNMLEGSGEGFGDDFEYPWSKVSSSKTTETILALSAEEEGRRILQRTIPRAIDLAQQGGQVRAASYGFKNVKIPHPQTGKPFPSQEIIPEEAKFIRMVFELKAQNWKNREIADELNNKGFSTRIKNRWNRSKSEIIGKVGGIPMDTKTIQNWLKNPVFAGFKIEKWTRGQLVQAPHSPIVSIKLWNKANKNSKDKYQIIKDQSTPDGWALIDGKSDEDPRNYSYNNPKFPFKDLIICPECQKNLKGSASKGKGGKYFPAYHCSRSGHKRVSINPTQLNQVLEPFFKRLQFKSDAAAILEIALGEIWRSKLKELNSNLIESAEEEVRLRRKCDEILEKIDMLSSPEAIKAFEKRFDETRNQLKELSRRQDQKKYTEDEVDQILKHARYFVEHLEALVLKTNDIHVLRSFWGLVFPKPPTLEELRNGTPQISPIFELKEILQDKDSFMAGAVGIEPTPRALETLVLPLYYAPFSLNS